MSETIRAARTASLRKALVFAAAFVAFVIGGALDFKPAARADGIYIGGGGFGISIGSRGVRGAYIGVPFAGFYGPPYRPYGAPYYYHPYDMRAYPYRSRVYVAPRGTLSRPQRVPPTKTGLAPFTPQWVAYCSRKYKSFNPNTGMFLAYSGKYRFCR